MQSNSSSLTTYHLLLTTFFLLFAPVVAHTAPLKVVTSFSILADMTRQIAADNAQILSLVGPDADTHAYEPTPSDVRTVADADLIIVNGLGLEGWLERLIYVANPKARIVTASEGITPLLVGGTPNPHAWQNIANGKRYVTTITAALTSADPTHKAMYEKNMRAYLKELDALDGWMRAQIAKIPPGKRRAIVLHDALRYFAQAYGIDFIAPLKLSASGDISAKSMAQLVDQIRSQHVRAVFLENMSDPRLATQLAADGGTILGGTLYSDALSPPNGPAPSYTAMFRHNVELLVKAMAAN